MRGRCRVGLNDQMEVIVHDGISEHIDGKDGRLGSQGFLEPLPPVMALIPEQKAASDTAIDQVIDPGFGFIDEFGPRNSHKKPSNVARPGRESPVSVPLLRQLRRPRPA